MKYFLHVLVMGMLFSLHSFSQTRDIIYINAPLPEICNTFNGGGGPFKIGECKHYPYSGGVLYNHNDSAIALKAQSGNTIATNLGTAYAIEYPFKEGYAYTIQVKAWQLEPALGAIHLDLSLINQLPNPNDSDPVSCGAVNQDHWASLLGAGIQIAGTYLDMSKNLRNLARFTAGQSYNYLTVLAYQGAPTGSWAFIREIIITEAPPQYTLAPANISKVCGTGLSQTFTITDVHNSGKVSSYLWDLGADNNGWLYNGAAAPRFITTTTPSLTLDAADCAVPSNVTVTVSRPSGNHVSNPAVVTTSNPATLSGPSESCGGATTYTVNNLTCGDVTWSLSSGAIGTLSNTTGPTTTLTTPAQNQGLTVIANIASSCISKTLSQSVRIKTKPNDVFVEGDPACQDGRIVQQSTFWATPATEESYNWSWRSGTGAKHDLPGHTAEISSKFSVGTYTISVVSINVCGQSNPSTYDFIIHNCSLAAASEQEDVSVAVSPNPASNVVVITANTTTSALKASVKQDIREVRIIDKAGQMLRKQSFPAGTTTATINVENFKPDIYMLQIGDGRTFKTRKIKIFR